jgi:DNA mismatch repair protein MutL
MTGKHPLAVINIAMLPQDVDVNIHPAKSEVKFRNETEVFRAVQKAVRRSLVKLMPVHEIGEPAASYAAAYPQPTPKLKLYDEETAATQPSLQEPLPFTSTLPVLRVVGQVMNCYIVAEGPDRLYLIDQHAAHERIRFDRLKKQRAMRKIEVQGLLEPAVFEVEPRRNEILKACYDELADYGFSLEPFGEKAYLVRAVPAMLDKEDWSEALKELVDNLGEAAADNREDRIIASIACHGAVLSGKTLTIEEIRDLIRQLEQTANPHTCPHGRPTMVQLGARQIEKEFGRG